MDTVDPVRFLAASMAVLGLLALFAAILKLYMTRRLRLPAFITRYLHVSPQGATFSPVQKTANSARLQLVESLFIDYKRKLVIVRRDDVEHVVLLAEGRETLIETIAPSGKTQGGA
jgi:hypothetical protein